MVRFQGQVVCWKEVSVSGFSFVLLSYIPRRRRWFCVDSSALCASASHLFIRVQEVMLPPPIKLDVPCKAFHWLRISIKRRDPILMGSVLLKLPNQDRYFGRRFPYSNYNRHSINILRIPLLEFLSWKVAANFLETVANYLSLRGNSVLFGNCRKKRNTWMQLGCKWMKNPTWFGAESV